MSRRSLIRCAECGKDAEPCMRHGIFCSPCMAALEAEMNTPKPQKTVEELFGYERRKAAAQETLRREGFIR